MTMPTDVLTGTRTEYAVLQRSTATDEWRVVFRDTRRYVCERTARQLHRQVGSVDLFMDIELKVVRRTITVSEWEDVNG